MINTNSIVVFRNTFKNFPKALSFLNLAAPLEFRLSIFGMLVSGITPVLMAYITKNLIDQYVKNPKASNAIFQNFFILAALMILAAIFKFLSDYMRESLREKIQTYIKLEIVNHASKMDLSYFEQPGNYDEFAKVRQELGYRPFLMAFSILFILQNVFTSFGYFLAFAYFSPFLFIILAISTLPVLFLTGKSGSETYGLNELTTPESRRSAYFEHLLTSDVDAKDVRLFSLSEHLVQNIRDISQNLLSKELKLLRAKNFRLAFAEIFSLMFQIFAYGYVLSNLVIGSIKLGDFVFFTTALLSIRSIFSQTLGSLGDFLEHSLFFSDLQLFFGIKSSIETSRSNVKMSDTPIIGFEINNLSFSYPGQNKKIIDSLNLRIQLGETTALVGKNGSGKSTFVKLLSRLYDPTEGEIKFDGLDIKTYDIFDYRSKLSVLLQDFLRYKLSLRENILLGDVKKSFDLASINDVAEKSGINLLINKLTDGWDTLLGRLFHVRGQDISGGEWQKVALARVLYRNTPILILDEPTAALDAEAETELFLKYKELTKGKLSLLISHRFNTVKMADRIIVLDAGQVVEDGTHAELLKLGGHYYAMYSAQAEAYREPEQGSTSPQIQESA